MTKTVLIGRMLIAGGWLWLTMAQAGAGDVRAMEFLGLKAGIHMDAVAAAFPLVTQVIYAEPEFPSLGVYYYRAVHNGQSASAGGSPIAIRLRADFDRQRQLLSYNYVATAARLDDLRPRLDAFVARYGAADRSQRGRHGLRLDYVAPWQDGPNGPQARLRIILERAPVKIAGQEVDGARLAVNFIDYKAEGENYAAAYYGAVIAERDRLSDGDYVHEELLPVICPEPERIRCVDDLLPGNEAGW